MPLNIFIKKLVELHENNVRINVIGNLERLGKRVRESALKAMNTTADNTGLILNIALNYGGRDEVLHAVKELIAQGLTAEEVTEQHISDHLYTKGQADPDLLIRTGGESRLSNFMLWQMAYTEFMFTDIYWPDFEVDVYYEMIQDYQKRNRRYGSAE